MATLGLSKVFILDKYFTELQKFWETEKKLQGRSAHIGEDTSLILFFANARALAISPGIISDTYIVRLVPISVRVASN